MTEDSRATAARNVRVVVAAVYRSATDEALLRRFVEGRHEEAFAALVERHGPMVLRLCRRVLGHDQDAEDAFQATFLVLARRAASVRKGESLASWLHGVAHRLALRARADAARRRRHERNTLTGAAQGVDDRLAWDEVRAALDEELIRLPEHLRTPLVLCYLEGRTQDEAAQQLGWSLNTLRRRLARGRELLGVRLERRGVSLAAALAAVLVSEAVTVAADLARTTVRAGVAVATGIDAAKVVSAGVAVLAEGGLRAMTSFRPRTVLVVLLALGVGAGVMMLHSSETEPRRVPPDAASKEQPGAPRTEKTDRFGDPLPPGAVVRMGTVRLQHRGSTVVFSANGKYLISAGADDMVRFWDPATGRLRKQTILSVPPPTEPERLAWYPPRALSADGKTVVVAAPGTLYVLETTTGKPIRRIAWGKGSAYRVAVSPDGRRVALNHGEGREAVLVWDTATDGEPLPLEHRHNPSGLTFSPDGSLLLTVGGGLVRLWDTAAGREVRRIDLGDNPEDAAFAPDGRTFAVIEGRGAVSVWDTVRGEKQASFREPEVGALHHLTFSRDGKALAVSGQQTLLVLDAARLKKQHMLGGKLGGYVAFAPDGKTVATAGPGAIHLWDVATGKPLHASDRHISGIEKIAWSPDGQFIASHDGLVDPAARLWDATTGMQLRSFQRRKETLGAFGGAPWSLAFFADPRKAGDGSLLLATGDHEGRVCVWEARSGREVGCYSVPEQKPEINAPTVYALHLSSDARRLTVVKGRGGNDESCELVCWEAGTGEVLRRQPTPVSLFSTFTPDGRQVVGLELDGWNRAVYDVDPLRLRVMLPPELTSPVVFSSDGRILAARSRKAKPQDAKRGWSDGWGEVDAVCLVERATGRPFLRIETGWVERLALSPDGRYLATADTDAIRLWEVATGRPVHAIRRNDTFSAPRGTAFVSCMAFSPDGRKLATGMHDTTVLVWDLVGEQKETPDVGHLWDDLAGEDAAAGYRAGWRMVGTPGQTVAFLKRTLRPAPAPDPKRLTRLLAELDSDEFDRREAAAAGLLGLGEAAESALRDLLRGNPSAEVRRRGEALLEKIRGAAWGPVAPGESLATLRAVGVLEHIGSEPAVSLLRELARGEPSARLTREANASLDRLSASAAP